jgi:hypothetical protein
MMTQDASERHSFILRIWREGKVQEWKGWAQHANSGETILFRSIKDLWTFIERRKGEPNPTDSQQQIQNGGQKKSGLK